MLSEWQYINNPEGANFKTMGPLRFLEIDPSLEYMNNRHSVAFEDLIEK